jgi:hypothetical protein
VHLHEGDTVRAFDDIDDVAKLYAMAHGGDLSKALQPVEFSTASTVHARVCNGKLTAFSTIAYRVTGRGKTIRGEDVVVFGRHTAADMYAKVGIVSADPKVGMSHCWQSKGYTISALIMDMDESAIRAIAEREWVPQFTEMAATRRKAK